MTVTTVWYHPLRRRRRRLLSIVHRRRYHIRWVECIRYINRTFVPSILHFLCKMIVLVIVVAYPVIHVEIRDDRDGGDDDDDTDDEMMTCRCCCCCCCCKEASAV